MTIQPSVCVEITYRNRSFFLFVVIFSVPIIFISVIAILIIVLDVVILIFIITFIVIITIIIIIIFAGLFFSFARRKASSRTSYAS